MVFSSLNFLFLFFPIVLLLYFAAPKNLRNAVLLVASIYFYAWGEPVYVVLMLISIAFNYVTGLQLSYRANSRMRRNSLVSAVIVNLAILGFFKYYGFAVETFNSVFGSHIRVRELALPIGISFYTFQAMSYVIDVYRGKVKVQKNLIDFAAYITMFPQLVAGPIVKYQDIELQLANRKLSLIKCGQGAERLIFGMAKKVILANNLGLLYDAVCAAPERSVMTAWLGALAYTMQIYFDFSGYSDMAIGMGKILGFDFMENFNYPYSAVSITDFWRRWHISLSEWFRDYVYIPLGGNRVRPVRHILNLLAVWALTGLWHGASWNFVIWGMYYGVLLIIEKYLLSPVLSRSPKAVARIYTMFMVVIGWVIFSNTDFSAMRVFLGNLFGSGASGFADGEFIYFLRSNASLIIVGAACCTPVLGGWFSNVTRRIPVLGVVICVLLFVISVAYLVYGTYNPFLYFRF